MCCVVFFMWADTVPRTDIRLGTIEFLSVWHNQSVWNQFKFSEICLISEICTCVCRYLSKRQHHWGGTASSTKTGAGHDHPIVHYTHTQTHKLDYYKSFVSNLTTDPTLTLQLTTLRSSGLRWASQFLYLHVLRLSPISHLFFFSSVICIYYRSNSSYYQSVW